MKNVKNEMAAIQDELIRFDQKLVQQKTETCHEEPAAKLVLAEMQKLGYDEARIDAYGNVLGRMGSGPVKVLFDAHLHTVSAEDADKWEYGPYSGDIVDGCLWGRGSVDTKSSAAAMVYAGYLLKRAGKLEGKTLYVSTSIMEEDYDGELLDRVMTEYQLKPDYAVIGEPSNLKLALGHRGRAMYTVTTAGVSAHGSTPELGINAVYKMQEIIGRVDALNKKLSAKTGEKGSVALTKIESHAASLNAVPDSCTIYLDRRTALYETEEVVAKEMDELVAGTDAQWKIYDAIGSSWTGKQVILHTFLPAWESAKESPVAQAGIQAYKEMLGKDPELFKWEFATNGFACAGRYHVPTIGLGPGDYALAHKTNEHCPLDQIVQACLFYAGFVATVH